MAVTARIESFNKDIALFIDDARSNRHFVDMAREAIEETKASNQSILGRLPPFQTFVDGNRGAPLESVKPGGVIVVEFELVSDVLRYIGEQLDRNAHHLSRAAEREAGRMSRAQDRDRVRRDADTERSGDHRSRLGPVDPRSA